MRKLNLQTLIDQQVRIATDLKDLETRIERLQGDQFMDPSAYSNSVLGWALQFANPQEPQKRMDPKSKKFSLSSVFSRASLELIKTQQRNLVPQNVLSSKKQQRQNRSVKHGKARRKKAIRLESE